MTGTALVTTTETGMATEMAATAPTVAVGMVAAVTVAVEMEGAAMVVSRLRYTLIGCVLPLAILALTREHFWTVDFMALPHWRQAVAVAVVLAFGYAAGQVVRAVVTGYRIIWTERRHRHP